MSYLHPKRSLKMLTRDCRNTNSKVELVPAFIKVMVKEDGLKGLLSSIWNCVQTF